MIQSEQVSSEIFNQLVELIGEYKDYEHKVNMLKPFGTHARIEKLLDSLRAHLFISQEDEELFINAVKEIVMKDFVVDIPAAIDQNAVPSTNIEKEPVTTAPSNRENNANNGTTTTTTADPLPSSLKEDNSATMDFDSITANEQ